jgi:hypothetical protein
MRDTWREQLTEEYTDPHGHSIIFLDGDIQFIGIYLPPISSAYPDAQLSILHRTLVAAETHPCTKKVLMGDLNLHGIISPGGRLMCDKSSEQVLADEILSAGFMFLENAGARFTFCSSRLGQSRVDYFCANQAAISFLQPRIRSIGIHEDWNIGSDHSFVTLESPRQRLTDQQITSDPRRNYNRWNLERLRTFGNAVDYACIYEPPSDELMKHVHRISTSDQDLVDNWESLIVGSVENAARLSIGQSRRRVKEIPSYFLTSYMREIVREKRRLLKRFRKHDLPDAEKIRVLHRISTLEKEFDDEMAILEQRSFVKFASDLNTSQPNTIMKKLKAISRQEAPSVDIATSKLPEFRQHFHDHFTSPRSPADDNTETMNVQIEPEIPRGHPMTISTEEVIRAIRAMPYGKATGMSGFSAELLKPICRQVSRPLSKLFSLCLVTGRVPSRWKVALIKPIPKKDRPSSPADYRPIAILEHMRKLFELCLQRRLGPLIDMNLNESQCGFRPNRSVYDHVATLNEVIIQHTQEFGYPPFIAFLDIKGAYDSVDRHLLWSCLRRMDIPPDLIAVLQSLFDYTESRITSDGYFSEPFHHRAGIVQGSVLSPLLYSAFIDDLAKALEPRGDLVGADGTPITSLLYADDIAIVANKQSTLSALLEICEHHSLRNNYRFNASKCVAFGNAALTIYGNAIQTAPSFKYLGVIFRPDGIDWDSHFDRLEKKATNLFHWFRSLRFGPGGYPEKINIHLYTTFIRSTMEFGLAIMPRLQSILNRLDSLQHSFLTRYLGVPRTTSKVSCLLLTALPSMIKRWEALRSRWGIKLLDGPEKSLLKCAQVSHIRWHRSSRSTFHQPDTLADYRILRSLLARSGSTWAALNQWDESKGRRHVEYLRRLRSQSGSWPSISAGDSDHAGSTQLALLSLESPKIRRWCIRWAVGRFFLWKRPCRLCGATLSQSHVWVHFPDSRVEFYLRSHRFKDAAAEIRDIIKII